MLLMGKSTISMAIYPDIFCFMYGGNMVIYGGTDGGKDTWMHGDLWNHEDLFYLWVFESVEFMDWIWFPWEHNMLNIACP